MYDTGYHKRQAPASDVDLFLWGLNEEQAPAKIKQIDASIRGALLVEATSVRTKNAVTIVSQHPTRHVHIVLRMYRSISEIVSGFDVDCSGAAYDGYQVYATPRALAAYMTQINTIDLSRRSPSYENRLAKHAHRGFEVYWPNLDRSRVDPNIVERSLGRTVGLARLLVLEQLPQGEERDAYLDQRRMERGRRAVVRWRRRNSHGNPKDAHEDEVAGWVDAVDFSDYHTFTVPCGPNFHARKVEKLIYNEDLLLNAEWNLPMDREFHLHRHPPFFGRVEDVMIDCCGDCPPQRAYRVYRPICERGAKSFLPGYGGKVKTPREAVLKLLRETKAKLEARGRAKRILVTLNEANEGTRRLLAVQLLAVRTGNEGRTEVVNSGGVTRWL